MGGFQLSGKTVIFFATDLHGSDKCFRKVLGAAKVYKPNAIIIGGDITGKMMVPIVEQPDGSWIAQWLDYGALKDLKKLEEVEAMLINAGYYPYRTNVKEMEDLKADRKKVDDIFSKLMSDRLRSWLTLAEQRLKGTGIALYWTGGNDDLFDVESILRSSRSGYVINPEGETVLVDEKYEMVSCGYADMTPWKCPRDIPDEELGAKLEEMTAKVKDFTNCIFNVHCPPYNSSLDMAPQLDQELRPVTGQGGVRMIPVGSRSVRKAVEKFQPLLGLHGHIHESRGAVNIGRTLCINPGSDYGDGIVKGVLSTLSEGRVEKYVLTQG